MTTERSDTSALLSVARLADMDRIAEELLCSDAPIAQSAYYALRELRTAVRRLQKSLAVANYRAEEAEQTLLETRRPAPAERE